MTESKVYFVSEPVQSQGNVMADMMTASIATSTYSQAETFLRETLQNACDQKQDGTSQIKFVVDVFQVSGKKKMQIDDFFASARVGLDPLNLSKLKQTKSFEALVVADVGTVGLVGPLDASVDESPSNFAGFFFNVGRPQEESNKAGSFGLGRTVLTSASDFSTVLVYSQFHYRGRLQRRFMGMSLAGAFKSNGRKFTGRHWIGKKPDQNLGLISPFEGKEAQHYAEIFGLQKYLGDETGFVALVVGNALVSNPESPTLARQQREQSIRDIQLAACTYGWPHMLGSKKNRSVAFQFLCDGEQLPEKDPAQMPGLEEFILCYEALSEHRDGVQSKQIQFSSTSGKEPTGTLTWLTIPAATSDLKLAKEGSIPISAIALMRQANFIVKYLEVTQTADQIATRGVFKSNEKYDSTFRNSEPVAHDDWIPSKLKLRPNSRNPIKQTIENIKENFRALSGKRSTSVDGSPSVVLGNVVGRLLDGLALTGSSRIPTANPPKTGGGKPTSRGLQIVPIGNPKISKSSPFEYSAIFKFQIIWPAAHDDLPNSPVSFATYAILENGNPELDPPDGADVPTISEISFEGLTLGSGPTVLVTSKMHLKHLEVEVTCRQGIAATCRVKVEEE